jgi:acyl carrier protein
MTVPHRSASYERILESLEAHVKNVIGVACVGSDDNLFDLGMESLMLVDMKDLIRESHGVSLKFSDFFSNFTISDLAMMIAERQKDVPA